MPKRKVPEILVPKPIEIVSLHPKAHPYAEGCKVCEKPYKDWKQIVDANGNPFDEEKLQGEKEKITYNPWHRRGHYRQGSYSTWNPVFNDRRLYSGYCYECWSQYSDFVMIVDGNYNGGLHLVTNWSNQENIKVERSSGEMQDGNKFFISQWNFKDVPESEKTMEDKKKEKETIVYCAFNSHLGEFVIFVNLVKDGFCAYKPIPISQIKKHNPDLPDFQFRFPNHVEYYKVLQWANKKTEWDYKELTNFACMSEWYNPDI
jgi:hypothetical protein